MLDVIEESAVIVDGTSYALVKTAVPGERKLAVLGNVTGFVGEKPTNDVLLCALTPENARVLRQRLSWLQPVVLGLRTSAGFGDRLGIATPGHVQAVRGTGVAPIFAQQSVRENTRTGRSPQDVVDDAMWGVLEAGWHEPWGADADHLKTLAPLILAITLTTMPKRMMMRHCVTRPQRFPGTISRVHCKRRRRVISNNSISTSLLSRLTSIRCSRLLPNMVEPSLMWHV